MKAFIILQEPHRGQVTEEEIIEWSRERMAAYKCPRRVEFVEQLPMTASGKILWRVLQEKGAGEGQGGRRPLLRTVIPPVETA